MVADLLVGLDALVLVGRNEDLLPLVETASVRAVVTDPPYGIGYMGEEWDEFRGSPGEPPGRSFQHWCERWMRQCLRVLQPGRGLASFGAARQVHRVVAAMRASGFERVRVMSWVYLTGYPKFLDLFEEVRERWPEEAAAFTHPRHTALKPAWEPVVIGWAPG